MQKKKVAMILIVIFVFAISFTILNFKYDRFYRINGIDNENRELIKEYLTEEEQNYLVENSFPMDRFLRFLTYDDFHLHYLEYYEQIEAEGLYDNTADVISHTNTLVEKLTRDNASPDTMITWLLDDDFVDDYLNNADFKLENLEYYELILSVQGKIDDQQFATIQSIIDHLNVLDEYGTERSKLDQLARWVDYHYQVEDIDAYLKAKVDNAEISLLENPDSLTTIVDDAHTISTYVPANLELASDVDRLDFLTYMRQDAYHDYKEMVQAALASLPEHRLLLTQAYRSSQSIENEYAKGLTTNRGGSSEYQLGLLIDVQEYAQDESTFADSELSQWLQLNAHLYGFVLRYPEGKEEVTGHAYSATTYRYVGKEIAAQMYAENWTLEEYLNPPVDQSEAETTPTEGEQTNEQ